MPSSENNKSHNDRWHDEKVADLYKAAEQLTEPFASALVKKSGLANYEGDCNVLDVGTGTGSVVSKVYQALKASKKGAQVLASDISQGMLDYVAAKGEQEKWTGLSTAIVDGNNVYLAPNTYTHILANFAVNHLRPESLSKINEILRPGGVFVFSVWAHYLFYAIFKDAAAVLDDPPPVPEEQAFHDVINKDRTPYNSRAFVLSTLQAAGFRDISVELETMTIECTDVAQLAQVFGMPLKFMAGMWEGARRDKWETEMQGAMLKVLEDGRDEDGVYRMEGMALVGSGWK